MKYRFAALLIVINLSIHSMNKSKARSPRPPTSARMGEEQIQMVEQSPMPHQNRLPTCSDILECLSCCCHATYVLACLSLQHTFNKDDHAIKRERLSRPYDKCH
jgi:hypothetical protein